MIPAEALVAAIAGAAGAVGSAIVAAVKTRRDRAAAREHPPRSVVLEVEGHKVDLSGKPIAEQERELRKILAETDDPAERHAPAEPA